MALPRIIVKRWPGAGIDILVRAVFVFFAVCAIARLPLPQAKTECSPWIQRTNRLQVNNAGMGRDNAALFDGKTSSWVEMISTNVLGPCMCTREALQVRSAAATKS